jgi:hypothetical protein
MLPESRRILLPLFESLQQVRADPFHQGAKCRAIQNALLEHITASEQAIRGLKQQVAALRHGLAAPQAVRPAKTESKQAKETIAALKGAIDDHERLIDVLRDVGDGLAFSYIDKWDIKPMAFKQSPGYLSGKEGLEFELKVFNYAFDHGHIALLNDLTHCLRYNDLTIFKNGRMMMVEAKTGMTLGQRDKRQAAARDLIREYLLTDDITGLYGLEQEVRRHALAHQEINHLAALNELIEKAVERGGFYREVEPGLVYIIDTAYGQNGIQAAANAIKGEISVAMVNTFKRANTAYFPFTLSIADSKRLFDFYAGELHIIIAFDMAHVRHHLANSGLTLTLLDDPRMAMALSREGEPDPPQSTFQISRHMWDRLFAEFLSLKWLLDELVSQYHATEAEYDALDKNAADEPTQSE